MNYIDILVIIVFGAGAIGGLMKGLVKEVGGLAALFIAIVGAKNFGSCRSALLCRDAKAERTMGAVLGMGGFVLNYRIGGEPDSCGSNRPTEHDCAWWY
jgi:Colicin V production protein.